MRNLLKVIDEIVLIAPELNEKFKSLRSSIMYSSPEIMHERWNEAAIILNASAKDHPKKNEIAKIFSGKKIS